MFQTTSNLGYGILFQNIQMPIAVTNLTTTNNAEGIMFKECSVIAELSNIQAHYNRTLRCSI